MIKSVITITSYDNGAYSVIIDGHYTYIKYNTGDCVWFDNKNNVINIKTHDGRTGL